MRRRTNISLPRAVRQPRLVAGRRTGAARANASVEAVVARVRDSLVLRRVGRKLKSAAEISADERRAR